MNVSSCAERCTDSPRDWRRDSEFLPLNKLLSKGQTLKNFNKSQELWHFIRGCLHKSGSRDKEYHACTFLAVLDDLIKTAENLRTMFCYMTLEKQTERRNSQEGSKRESCPKQWFSDPAQGVSGGCNPEQEGRISKSNQIWKESGCVWRYRYFPGNHSPSEKVLYYWFAWL